ncbi:hypothetical protein AnigIFM63604_002330 [Aspergillus niger]|uniref:Methyltransferase domain-containing protein n=1 Tax=Aspergillus niger TaxID=5061 RepID=A0A9W6EGE5_ASPNG|nr:hypothetical protein AnigIFM63604_002330 [Aspergillus niger]
MASFSDEGYDCSAYAAYRPSPPKALYDTVLAYHQSPRELCVDLGTGHGAVARALATHFKSVLGVDSSEGMLKEAARAQQWDIRISVFNNEWMYPVECRDFANWTDLTRLVSVPANDDAPGVSNTPGAIQMRASQTLGSLEILIRTLSMVHEWRKAHPEALSVREGGSGDCVDTLMRDIIEGEEKWRVFVTSGGNWRDIEVGLEMRSILLMARKKQFLSYCEDPHQHYP